ncbi:hypothetical protein PR003_g17709 [Phytophthora rubi]|uniref:Uncharacterized protein n=1 Tax=Phytophthora rubi TaxID=129364 RepID=A0A6A3JJ20_9STRA|nr:hypothetical protein PR002_g19876 [Phytophthora rubi]KAE9007530.1 hypothetical protein PR001_g16948 [Phytophthora rubi]KAE9320465.1 hypothetical protein PR003_g17709 [Phytophthora rubi]
MCTVYMVHGLICGVAHTSCTSTCPSIWGHRWVIGNLYSAAQSAINLGGHK